MASSQRRGRLTARLVIRRDTVATALEVLPQAERPDFERSGSSSVGPARSRRSSARAAGRGNDSTATRLPQVTPPFDRCGSLRARDHMVVERDARMRRILWWRAAATYGWSIAVRELVASPRWPSKSKAETGVLVGFAISFPVTFAIGVPYVYWVLTGRGPWRRYGFSSAVVINPFRAGYRRRYEPG